MKAMPQRLARPDFRDTVAESFVIAIQRLYLAAEDDAKTGTLTNFRPT